MSSPRTPTKKRESFNDCLIKLNTKWGLDLPIQNGPTSPSESGNRGSVQSKIVTRLKKLYYKDSRSLNQVLELFDEHAKSVYTQWVYKSHADVDTLPSRVLRKREHSALLFKRALNPKETDAVLKTLLRFIDDHEQNSLQALSYSPIGNSTRVSTRTRTQLGPFQVGSASFEETTNDHTNLSSDDEEMKQQSDISSFFKKPSIPARAQYPSEPPRFSGPPGSSHYGSSLSDGELLGHLEGSNKHGDGSTDNEQYETPPEGPPKNVVAKPSSLLLKSSPQRVPIPSLSRPNGTKRRSTGDEEIRVPNKISRGISLGSTHHDFPIQHHNPVGFYTPAAQSLSRSASTTSLATVVSASESFPTPETAQTSFGSTDQGSRPPETKSSTIATSGTFCVGTSSTDANSGHDAQLAEAQLKQEMMDNVNSSSQDTARAYDKTLPQISRKGTIDGATVEQYLKEHLNPFADEDPRASSEFSFRVVYEMSRIASQTKIPINELYDALRSREQPDFSELNDLYSAVQPCLSKYGKRILERSTPAAWSRAQGTYDDVDLAGTLAFSKELSKSPMSFRLRPLKKDKSYLLARKFGGDRFLIVDLPCLEPKALPEYLSHSPDAAKSAILDWIMSGSHSFLGRTWSAFYLKTQQASTKTLKENRGNFNSTSHQVYFFATDGVGFLPHRFAPSTGKHAASTIRDLLEWFMDPKSNADQTALKFFARLALAVSRTWKTLQFKQWQIIRCDDAYASNNPVPRRLDMRRSKEKKAGKKTPGLEKTGAVMDDGCARMSYYAAKHVAAEIGLNYVPSAFQGRIAGAKGMWMVDYTDESSPGVTPPENHLKAGVDPSVWIEITDSQMKFECPDLTSISADPLKLTFMVNDFSKPLTSAALNFQLLSILTEQKIPKEVFETLLKDDLTTKTAELKAAMSDPVALSIWNEKNFAVRGRRSQKGHIEWLGGFPNEASEQINCLVEHGFSPQINKKLNSLCYEEIQAYSAKLRERMHIGIGRSCYALMLADPSGTLEEDEVHLGFSSCFTDERSGFAETMLHEVDVLVARLPASLPSDVQKRRAVFNPALAGYKDVIIFPVKGDKPLADMLSGGDYDGDRAWICWEPSMVDSFENAPVKPLKDYAFYGISKDKLKVSDVLKCTRLDETHFLRHGFNFALEPSMLGIVTNYHESFIYQKFRRGYNERCVSDPDAVRIAMLLGYLVDAAKGGFKFGMTEWDSFKNRQNLPRKLERPPYLGDKIKRTPGEKNHPFGVMRPKFNKEHIADYLMFVVTKRVVDEALGDFAKQYQDKVPSYDPDVNAVWSGEEEFALKHENILPGLRACLIDLKVQLDELNTFWQENLGRRSQESREKTFNMIVEETRERFLGVEPRKDQGHAVLRWGYVGDKRNKTALTSRTWDWLKASLLFNRWHASSKFVWSACGKELCEIKAMRVSENVQAAVAGFESKKLNHQDEVYRTGGTRMMVSTLHLNYKVDGRLARRIQERHALAEQEEGLEDMVVEEQNEFDSEEWMSVMSEIGYV